MAIVISSSQAATLRQNYQKAMTTVQRMRKERVTANAMDMVVQSAEVAGGALLAGYVRGRMEAKIGASKYAIMGIEPEAVVGAGLIAAAYFKSFGKYDDHAASVGAGLLATTAFSKGKSLGAEHASGVQMSGIL